MTEIQTAGGVLMTIGTVAAHNIAGAIGMPERAPEIETAIKDEIDAMSSHFTLAMADISTQHEIAQKEFANEVARVKSTYNYVRANWVRLVAVQGVIFVLGVVLGHFA
jgi:hypothetical protein